MMSVDKVAHFIEKLPISKPPAGAPQAPLAAAQPAAAKPVPAQPAANKPANAPAAEKKYTLTLSVNIQNLLNHTNLTNPIGNLSSPNFGQSISTAGGFGGPGGSSAAGNRRIQVQVRLGF